MKKSKNTLTFCVITVIIFELIANHRIISREITESLRMWATVLIPSLFPYLVISKYIVQKGFPDFFYPLKRLISKFFNISYASSEVFLCSLLCGYPCGGICASDIYNKDLISKNEAARLICFTNGASPVFLICAVGGVMLGNISLGIMMYCVQTISSVTLGFILGLTDDKVNSSKNKKNLNCSSITECCELSVTTIINIAGYLITATALAEIIMCIIYSVFGYQTFVRCGVYCLIEISKAMALLAENGSSDINFALMCACASFGGLSVIMQIFGVIDKNLRSFKIIAARFFSAFTSFIIGLSVKNLKDIKFINMNPYVPIIVSLILSVIIFICFIYAKKKQTIP